MFINRKPVQYAHEVDKDIVRNIHKILKTNFSIFSISIFLVIF